MLHKTPTISPLISQRLLPTTEDKINQQLKNNQEEIGVIVFKIRL